MVDVDDDHLTVRINRHSSLLQATESASPTEREAGVRCQKFTR